MRTLLVTGGAGFIGANFVHMTRDRYPGDRVIVVDKLTYAGNRANLDGADVEFIEGDICDAELVDAAVARADVVVHFAAESHNDNSLRDPRPFVDTNVVGSGSALRSAVICFYLSNEGLSVLENAAHIGLPVPDKLKDILAQLHGREDDKTDAGDTEDTEDTGK